MKSYTKYLLFLLIGIALYFYSNYYGNYYKNIKPNSNDGKQAKAIQQKLDKALATIRADGAKIKKHLSDSKVLSFSVLNQETQYPFYIINENKVILWSTNVVVPDMSVFDDTLQYKYVEYKLSKFVRYYTNVSTADGKYFKAYFLLPLYNKSFIQNDYISSSFNTDIFEENTEIYIVGTAEKIKIKDPSGKPLFGVLFNLTTASLSSFSQYFLLALNLGYLLCIGLYGLLWSRTFFRQHLYFVGFCSAGLTILFVRISLLQHDIPFSIIPFDTFNSKFFASSPISTSLGDFLINSICVCIAALLVYAYALKLNVVKLILHSTAIAKCGVSVLLILLSQISFGVVYSIFRIINQHSQWIFDITHTLYFNHFHYISVVVFIMICISFFCINHVLVRLYLTLNRNKPTRYFIIAIFASALVPLLMWGDQNYHWPIVLLNLAFIALQYKLHMPRVLERMKYSSYLYLIAVAMMCAVAGAVAVYKMNQQKTFNEKNKFASKILIESDVLEEYLLKDINFKIEQDEFIVNILSSPFNSKDLIERKIQKIYLANYFEKYDANITVYNTNGQNFEREDENSTFQYLRNQYALRKYATEYTNIFFINASEVKNLPKYVIFNQITKNNVALGYLVIQLKNKKIIPYSVFPELLIDKKFRNLNQPRSFSYAIFSGKEMQSNYGMVNYEKDFSPSFLDDSRLYNEGVDVANLNHTALKDKNSNSVIVVSSEKYSWLNVLSNFSFLFIILLIIISLYLLSLKIFAFNKDLSISYASKIQLYLNVAFILPLWVIAITTLSVIGSMYQKNLEHEFVQKAENIGNRIAIFFDEHKNEKIRKETLNEFIIQLSKYTEIDINFFNAQGSLLSTSQPNIYQKGLLSTYLNPKAFREIRDHKSNLILLNEHVGNLYYHSVYIAVKEYNTAQLLGILSIPFFESRQEVEKQMIEVFTTIINIFTSIFTLFLILSYLVSRNLTIPLMLITQSIKKTSLGATNEPIRWKSEDEIGLLVGEYNTMLTKLAKNKEELKNVEKENAWREMAQQVAHEIKNPLTPMKLTIQYLSQNILSNENVENQKIKKGLVTILQQIDSLNEIATSFSDFAKMPSPDLTAIDAIALVESAANLYSHSDAQITIADLPSNRYMVNGDAKLFSGILSNIMLNAIQSIPKDRVGTINISVTTHNKHLVIAIADNGVGIPEELQSKIFLPHFSTKYSGSGIGLALAKQGIEYMGGRIWFDSKAQLGTTFFVELKIL